MAASARSLGEEKKTSDNQKNKPSLRKIVCNTIGQFCSSGLWNSLSLCQNYYSLHLPFGWAYADLSVSEGWASSIVSLPFNYGLFRLDGEPSSTALWNAAKELPYDFFFNGIWQPLTDFAITLPKCSSISDINQNFEFWGRPTFQTYELLSTGSCYAVVGMIYKIVRGKDITFLNALTQAAVNFFLYYSDRWIQQDLLTMNDAAIYCSLSSLFTAGISFFIDALSWAYDKCCHADQNADEYLSLNTVGQEIIIDDEDEDEENPHPRYGSRIKNYFGSCYEYAKNRCGLWGGREEQIEEIHLEQQAQVAGDKKKSRMQRDF